MTFLAATATTLLRTGLFLLLVLGVVARPALNHIGELHGLEHAAAAAHHHDGDHGHRHADGAGHAPAHAVHAHAHDAGRGNEHAGEEGMALADTGHAHARGHAEGHHPGHSHGHGHVQGSHSLLHQVDAGASVGILPSLYLPDAFGPALMPLSPVTATAPSGHRSSPFRPPIG